MPERIRFPWVVTVEQWKKRREALGGCSRPRALSPLCPCGLWDSGPVLPSMYGVSSSPSHWSTVSPQATPLGAILEQNAQRQGPAHDPPQAIPLEHLPG